MSGPAKPRLSARAIERLRETTIAEREAGSSEVATAIELLLAWYAEAHGDPRATA